jgi:methionyl-tRNA synthetase
MNQPISRHFVSASLPYVNALPHVGFAFELVLADAIARAQRQRGADTVLVTGTDDNSLKNVRAAETARLPVADFVDAKALAFEALPAKLGVALDGFVRTSRSRTHRAAVEQVFTRCAARGDVYQKTYEGLYCVGCEAYFQPRELEAGRCPVHGVEPERVQEANYFFRLSRYQQPLLELLRSGRLAITPTERHNEALRFVERGLNDFSISRSLERARGWGLSVPGDSSQVVYVWFDALIGYFSALGFPERSRFDRYWTESASRLHVIGKDILRFHALYWPAILLSLGEALPTRLLVHGFLSVDGRKIGKSSGNAVDPLPLAARWGSDGLRHYFTRHLPTTQDSDFSARRLAGAYASELAHQLGNLVSRTLALVLRHCGGRWPACGEGGGAELELDRAARSVAESTERAWLELDVNAAARSAWELLQAVNRYLDRTAPWQLAKLPSEQRRLEVVLAAALASIEQSVRLTQPFLPEASAKVLSALALPAPTAIAPLFPLRAVEDG